MADPLSETSVAVGSRWRDREGTVWEVVENKAGWVNARGVDHPNWFYSGDALIDFKPPKMERC